MDSLLRSKVLKGLGWMVGVLAALVALWYLAQYFAPEKRAERAYFSYYEKLLEKALQDEYGGMTPQETLDLFREALEKGDIDLASRYFVVDWQSEAKDELSDYDLNAFIENLNRGEFKYVDEDMVHFTYSSYFSGGKISIEGTETNVHLEPGYITNSLELVRSSNGRWKIRDL